MIDSIFANKLLNMIILTKEDNNCIPLNKYNKYIYRNNYE